MVPLKLYASVTGRFTVERDLSTVTSKVRESAQDAAKERSSRKTIKLNSPPPGVATPTTAAKPQKKTKSSTMFRGAARAAAKANTLPVPTPPSAPPRVASPAPRPSPRPSPRPPTRDLIPVRKRLVHCLAVAERSKDEVLRLIMGSDPDANAKRDLASLLEEVAEPIPGKSSKWRLKAESWLDIRPHEWPQLTESERTAMIHQARQAFAALKLPDADPAWEHIRLRPSANAFGSSSTISRAPSQSTLINSDPPPTKPAPSSDPRRAKQKKPNPGTVNGKEERATPTLNGSRNDDVRPSPSLPSKPPPTRRPGSGFKLPRQSPHDGQSDTAESPIPPPAQKPKLDSRRRDRDRAVATSSSSSKPSPLPSVPDRERKVNGSAQPPPRVKREPPSDVERERIRDDRIREKESERRDQKRAPEIDRHPRVDDGHRAKLDSTGTLKRKKPPRDADEQEYVPSRSSSSMKRQKTDGQDSLPPPSKEDAPSRKAPTHVKTESTSSASWPKLNGKRDLSPDSRSRRDESPRQSETSTFKTHPTSRNKYRTSPTHSPNDHQRSGSYKARRRSPVFTSSEDESNKAPSISNGTALPTPPSTTRPSHYSSHGNSRLTPDHASLRSRYKSAYRRYLSTFQKIVAQQSKIENMLNDENPGSDADSDVELMDAEDLTKLVSEHRRQHDELETIQQEFSQSTERSSI
ncbi:hypothetical protein ONZ45_g6603 [Pleurotus djamor]|nr:hypothetical protein ONZ45_g6603 [Pleurotus djamor]